MAKIKLGPTTNLLPMPVVLVGAIVEGQANFMTVAWAAIASRKPPSLTLALGKAAHTVKGIEEEGLLSVNVPSPDLVEKVDFCGLYSGRKEDKAALYNISRGELTGAPLVDDCPLCFECRVISKQDLNSNWLYLVKILEVHVDQDCLTDDTPDLAKINPLIFTPGGLGYYGLGDKVGPAFKIGKKS
jgi:flavin reductase (DIM6/NTAB) family NADH-FMN oxidoreductase RutF